MNATPHTSSLYAQALEILSLSRNLSTYLGYDFSTLDEQGNEHPHIYFTGDMVRQSDALAPGIIMAASQPFQDDRMHYALSLEQLTHRLYTTCERLERAESNGRDFVRHLRRELKKFRVLQRNWIMTL